MKIPFFLVDVFAERPLAGNPLAVVPYSQMLDDSDMPRIAGELNQTETTFLLPVRDASADWRLRSFTASGREVFGAGHNSLGAWWWLAESGALRLSEGPNHFTQQIGDRLLPVEVHCHGERVTSVTLVQTSPLIGDVCENVDALAVSLGLEPEDLRPQELPAQVVSTGAAHLLVPVRSREAICRAHPDAQALAKILKAVGGQGCYLFTLDTVLRSSSAHTRFFNPTVGIVEDSATGSAAGPLASYLVAHGITADGTAMTIEQGYEMGRPSLLAVQVSGGMVRLTGRCVTVADAMLRIQ
jgi:trans-2,3-dihydro-3-hydroxyanthranilate isomerase